MPLQLWVTHNCQHTSDGHRRWHRYPWGLFAWRHKQISHSDWNWPSCAVASFNWREASARRALTFPRHHIFRKSLAFSPPKKTSMTPLLVLNMCVCMCVSLYTRARAEHVGLWLHECAVSFTCLQVLLAWRRWPLGGVTCASPRGSRLQEEQRLKPITLVGFHTQQWEEAASFTFKMFLCALQFVVLRINQQPSC